MARREQRRELLAIADEVNPIKSRLMDLYNRLNAAGCHTEAESLDKVIARLQSWQDRAKR